MCKATIERAVIDKINDKYKSNFTSINEIKEYIGYDMTLALRINNIINTLKICDPAVGSGHFLVSALNRIIAIKSELGVLFKHKSRERLVEYKIVIKDDVLCVLDGQKNYFVYDKNNDLSQQVQETLFNEKRIIIEECLFGVDINSKAVAICQLRLWIELLKNAYYKYEDGVMETLPNIDINIKCGNSLIHKIDYEIGKVRKNQGFKKSTQVTIRGYKEATIAYKACSDKLEKKKIKLKIKDYKDELFHIQQIELFECLNDKERLRLQLKLYANAFEWAVEFPEILSDDEKDTFLGFDILMGNTPYGIKIVDSLRTFLSKQYPSVPDYEIYYYFISLAHTLLSKNGLLVYIIPNTFLVNKYAEKYRNLILENWTLMCINNLTDMNVFEQASVRNCIIQLTKTKSDVKHNIVFANTSITPESKVHSACLIDTVKIIPKKLLKENPDNWLKFFYEDAKTLRLVNKIKLNSKELYNYARVSQGLIPYDKYRGHSEETIKNRVWHSNYPKDDTYKMELQGKDLNRYIIKWNGNTWISYGEWLAAPRKKEFFTEPRILVREITNPRILASYTCEEYYNTPSIINLIDFNGTNVKYILGLINSKLISFYHIKNSPKANKGLFPKILVSDVRNIPIVLGDEESINKIEKLVDEILLINKSDSNKEHKNIKILEKEIDDLVYKIYKINDTNIKIVEKCFDKKEE